MTQHWHSWTWLKVVLIDQWQPWLVGNEPVIHYKRCTQCERILL